MKSRLFCFGLWSLMTGLFVFTSAFSTEQSPLQPPPQRLSHVRVVRLSYVSGTVTVKRPGADEWAKALVNTPIQEGFTLSTTAGSFAEVEFENGSTARLGEDSQLVFTQLAIDAEGDKLNRLAFDHGYGTFHFLPEKGDLYTVQIGDALLTPRGKTEFRADLRGRQVRIEDFFGSVSVESQAGSAVLGKDKVLQYDVGTTEAFNIQHGIEKDEWDNWASARDKQTVLASNDQAVRLHGSIYGWDDLDAYGDWAYVPGFGYGWAPYEASGWMPFTDGMWNWYSSFGWTWISGEPWGWLPYHYGSWNFAPGFGWMWMPGSFDNFSPGWVSWYGGQGWIGWAPFGVGGSSMVAVPAAVVQSGQPINPRNVIRAHPVQAARINGPTFQPTTRAMLSGIPMQRGFVPSARAFAPGASGARVIAAPQTILMGGNAASERAVLDSHPGLWGRFIGNSRPEPLRAHMGTTLGGQFPTAEGDMGRIESGNFGGARPSEGNRPRISSRASGFAGGSNRGGAFVLPHTSAAAVSFGGGEVRGGTSGSTISSSSESSGIMSGPISSSPVSSGGGRMSSGSGGARSASSGGSRH